MFNILILGRTGMLGRSVFKHLTARPDCKVDATQRIDRAQPLYLDVRSPEGLLTLLAHRHYDYVINCTGVLKSLIDENDPRSLQAAITVNAVFPHVLSIQAAAAGTRVIHVSTDGVFSGRSREPYQEDSPVDCLDHYGKTKALGESPGANVLNLRCSVIGRDPERKRGLVEWLLSIPAGGRISGYAQNFWNGVTTLQFAGVCERLIMDDGFRAVRAESGTHHFCPNPPISKYDLLRLLHKAVNSPALLAKDDSTGTAVSRILATRYRSLRALMPETANWETNIAELIAA